MPTYERPRRAPTAPTAPAGLAAREAAAALLAAVVDRRDSLDRLLDEMNGLDRWRRLAPRDRALARAIATTALRQRGRIAAAFARLTDRPPPARARHLGHVLHVAAAQILFLDVPASAAVNLAVAALAGEPRSSRFSGFANAVLRRMCREREALLALPADAATVFPGWLARRLVADHGRRRADAIAAMVLCRPVLDLTAHPRLGRAERAALGEALGATVLPTGSLRLADPRPVAELPGFADGAWWVQDAAASLPARLIGDVAGLAIADLCAAPGGKTAQLAAAGARVTAVDISPTRLARLADNLARLRLSAEVVAADILAWQPPRRFDAVLLDAPCSATGTLRRHPDIAWNKTADDVAALVELQRRMIGAAAAMVRPGGLLVYANCSILKSEGEDLLAGLLAADRRLSVVPVAAAEIGGEAAWINGQGALRTLPCDLPREPACAGGLDGFFACRLRVGG